MRTRHSLQTLVKYLDYKSHARYLLSRHPDMCAYTCLLGVLVLASLHPPPQENRFRQRETKEEEIEEDEAGGLTRKKKVEKASTDVILARSTRSDARWSCPVYPNYLLSRQIRMHRLRRAFYGNFLPFFSASPFPRLMTHCMSKRRRNASRRCLYRRRRDIRGLRRGNFVTAWRMSRCVRVLL